MTPHPIRSIPGLTLALSIFAAATSVALGARPAVCEDAKPAAAAAPGAAPAKALAADDKVILPFVGEDTFIVGRLDLARVDTPAFEQYVNDSMDTMAAAIGLPPQAVKEMKDSAAAGVKELREGLEAFRDAGGHYVYVLVGTDLMANNAGPVLVAPVRAGADKETLSALFTKMSGDGSREVAGEVGNAVVLATQAQIDTLKQRVEAKDGAAPPDLAKAFAVAGDAPFRLAVVPNESARTLMHDSIPPIPQEVGGGDPSILTEGIRWATLAVTQKPDMQMKITLQAADADAGKRVVELLNKSLEFAKNQPGPPGNAETWARQLESIKPKQHGETITMSMDASLLSLFVGGRAVAGAAPGQAPPQPDKPDDGGL